MAKIFLSYRRSDSAGVAGRIYDRLRAHFGDDAVFMDIDSIPFGEDFRTRIDLAVSQADLVLAVIGPRWSGKSETSRRIDDSRDFVRIEIESALKRGIPVIPVLLDRTRMPTEAEVPPSLATMTYRNAIEVDQGRDFHPHVDRLVKGIEIHLEKAKAAGAHLSSQNREIGPRAPIAKAPEQPQNVSPLKIDQRSKPAPRVERRTRRNIPWLWLYVAAIPLLALLGVIIYIVTDKGTVKIMGTDAGMVAGASTAASPTTRVPFPDPSAPQTAREWTNTIGMKFVRIEAGEFLMGTTKDQVEQLMRLFPDSKRADFDDEQPQHSVKISQAFFLGIHEVTQVQYQAVMGENPSFFKGSDDLPVEKVPWLDAVGFCNKLSERENRKPFYRMNGRDVSVVGGNGYRLPTEAEWEYACRAKSATLYPFGDDAGKLGEHAWHDGNAGGKTHPVGQKPPNAWGLYDMLGNVWEWCADGYDEKCYASSLPFDPPGASVASRRVVRGGSWFRSPWGCRPARRSSHMPAFRNDRTGLRVAAVQE
jgi:formylglycine-generating enzyme required for sulfatase activity